MNQQELIQRIDESGDFVTLDDGFVYYWPSGNGSLAAYVLRWIADELDKRNKEWNKQINDYFEKGNK